jgi:transposase
LVWDDLRVGRGDLTEGQWPVLKPLLPSARKRGRPTAFTRRDQVNPIRWRTRTGAPWRDVPERYGPWESAYSLFRRWQRDGTWARVLGQLQARADARGLITWDVNERRLHGLPRAPARRRGPQKGDLQREPPGGLVDEPADHALGRSRGGLTTKIHLVVEQGQRPAATRPSPGPGGPRPIPPPRARPLDTPSGPSAF